MPLFCKQCDERRYPIYQAGDSLTLWLCEKCENYTDSDDNIVREQTDDEKNIRSGHFEDVKKFADSDSGEKLNRRKGVN